MEVEALAQLLLTTLGLAAVLASLAFFRTTTEHSGGGGAPNRRQRRRTIVVSDPGIVQLMLIDHADAFSSRPLAPFNGAHSINSVPHGPMWRALRCNLTSDIFRPTRLHLLAALQREAAEALVAGLSTTGDEVVVVRDSLHSSVFALSARFCFGDGISERSVRAIERVLQQFVLTFVQDSALFAGSSMMTRLRHWRRWLRWSGLLSRVYKLVYPIIAARKQSRGSTGRIRSYVDSLLDLQVPADDSDNGGDGSKRRRPLTDKEMVILVFEFLGTSTGSTVSCVEWTLAHLVIDREVQKKLHREIAEDNGMVVSGEERLHRRLPYLRAVMLESLRLHPPVPTIPRDVSAKDAAIAVTPAARNDDTSMLPANVTTDVQKIGRNSKVWTDPDEFRPERFLAGGEAEGVGPVPGPKEIRMVPFGAGRRYCPGVDVAMVRVGCILTALVRNFEWALPAGGNSLDLKEFGAFVSMMKTPLRARITPRARCLLSDRRSLRALED